MPRPKCFQQLGEMFTWLGLSTTSLWQTDPHPAQRNGSLHGPKDSRQQELLPRPAGPRLPCYGQQSRERMGGRPLFIRQNQTGPQQTLTKYPAPDEATEFCSCRFLFCIPR